MTQQFKTLDCFKKAMVRYSINFAPNILKIPAKCRYDSQLQEYVLFIEIEYQQHTFLDPYLNTYLTRHSTYRLPIVASDSAFVRKFLWLNDEQLETVSIEGKLVFFIVFKQTNFFGFCKNVDLSSGLGAQLTDYQSQLPIAHSSANYSI